jgi:hypothetical protein
VGCEMRAQQSTREEDVRYYDRVASLYHDDTTRFDAEHPFYGRLFTDTRLTDELLHRMEAHERRFEFWSPNLYRFLDGYWITHPIFDVGIPHSVLGAPVHSDGGGGGSNPHDPDGGNGSVPEPTTFVLMISGLMSVATYLIWRKRKSAGPSAKPTN